MEVPAMKRKEKGFTLTEVMIVIVILATMATMVIPRLTGQPERAAVAEAIAHLSAMRQANEAYHLEHAPDFAPNTAALDVTTTSTKFTYTVGGTTSGTVTATRNPAGACTTNFDGCTIILAADGTWGGTHPLRPTN